MNTQTGSKSNIVVQSSTEDSAEDSRSRESSTGDGASQSASLVPGQITSPVPGQYNNMGSGHDFACSVRSGRKSCQGDIASKVPELVKYGMKEIYYQDEVCDVMQGGVQDDVHVQDKVRSEVQNDESMNAEQNDSLSVAELSKTTPEDDVLKYGMKEIWYEDEVCDVLRII